MTQQDKATREAIAQMNRAARSSGCNGTGCDLIRWLRAGTRVSATCSICHRIYSAERLTAMGYPI